MICLMWLIGDESDLASDKRRGKETVRERGDGR
jgi:hypothetical protein